MSKEAKKETKPAPEGEKTKGEFGNRGAKDLFKRVYAGSKPATTDKKVAPQAQVIVNAVETAGKGGITREDLVKALDGNLTTRQPIGRIVSYYQKPLIEAGLITVDKA
jgi:hypothetical protein